MSCLIRLVSAVRALSQSQSCLESWDLYLSMAALSVIKGFSFDSHSSFHLDENTIKIKHCILASSAICEIIHSHYLRNQSPWDGRLWSHTCHPLVSRAYFLGPPPPMKLPPMMIIHGPAKQVLLQLKSPIHAHQNHSILYQKWRFTWTPYRLLCIKIFEINPHMSAFLTVSGQST